MLIVGSAALKFHYPNYPRMVKDIDVICFKNDLSSLSNLLNPTKVIKGTHTIILRGIQKKSELFYTNNVEMLLADESESLKMYLEYDKGKTFASKEVLFSLKKSHINFPIKFQKHIHDYCYLQENLDGFDQLSHITIINHKETESRLGKLKTPSLNQTVDQFFGQSKDYVKTHFIHDEVHKIMAHYQKPLYEKMQCDTNLAKCDRELWRLFTYEDKCKCVLEEAYVIALERKILPMLFNASQGFTSDEAFDWALMRICTNLCSGWFREFATNNYFIIKKLYNKNYVEKFLLAYENGNITRQ